MINSNNMPLSVFVLVKASSRVIFRYLNPRLFVYLDEPYTGTYCCVSRSTRLVLDKGLCGFSLTFREIVLGYLGNPFMYLLNFFLV